MPRGDHYPRSGTEYHKSSYIFKCQCIDQSCMKDQGADTFEEILVDNKVLLFDRPSQEFEFIVKDLGEVETNSL